MTVITKNNIRKCIAINEVSILRQSRASSIIYQLKIIQKILLKN